MVGETADPVLLSSRAGGRWLTAGAFVLAAALLATQSFDLKRSAAPKPDFAMEFRIAETVKPAPDPTPEVKKVPEVKQVPKAAPVTAVPPVKREAQKPRVIASRTAVSPVTVEEPKPTVAPAVPEIHRPVTPLPAVSSPAAVPTRAATPAVKKSPAALPAAPQPAVKTSDVASKLIALVERKKRYPKSARRSGTEGVLEITFSLSPAGKILKASVSKGSGFSVLDAAGDVLASALIGESVGETGRAMKITVPLRYSLKNS